MKFLNQKICVSLSKATGIELERFGRNLKIKAKKEVILSAGSVSSPHLLLLSGIGAKKQLEMQDIPIVQELPGVGENLQDHLMTSLWLHSQSNEQLGVNPFDSVNPINYIKFLIWGRGPLVSNGIETGAFFQTSVCNDSWKRPDIQFQTLSSTLAVDYGLKYKDAFNIANEYFYGTYGAFNGM